MPIFVSLNVISTDILPKIETVAKTADLRGHLIPDSELKSIITDGFQAIDSLALTDLNKQLTNISNRGATSFQSNRPGNLTEAHILMRAQVNTNSSDLDVYATTLTLYKYRGSEFNEVVDFDHLYSKMEKKEQVDITKFNPTLERLSAKIINTGSMDVIAWQFNINGKKHVSCIDGSAFKFVDEPTITPYGVKDSSGNYLHISTPSSENPIT